MAKKIKLSEAFRNAAKNENITQGFDTYFSLTEFASEDSNKSDQFLCACALGAALFCSTKRISKKKMFNNDKYISDLLIKKFGDLDVKMKKKDLYKKISVLPSHQIDELMDLLEHNSYIRIGGFTTSLNDFLKYNFTQIADIVELLGY